MFLRMRCKFPGFFTNSVESPYSIKLVNKSLTDSPVIHLHVSVTLTTFDLGLVITQIIVREYVKLGLPVILSPYSHSHSYYSGVKRLIVNIKSEPQFFGNLTSSKTKRVTCQCERHGVPKYSTGYLMLPRSPFSLYVGSSQGELHICLVSRAFVHHIRKKASTLINCIFLETTGPPSWNV